MLFCIYCPFPFKTGEISMQTVELTVELKTPDVIAQTAASALRGRMGYESALVSLSRADYFRLAIHADNPQQAVQVADTLARDTTLFLNPLKHRYQVQPGLHNSLISDDDGAGPVHVLVTDDGNEAGKTILKSLHDGQGVGEQVQSVVVGTLWALTLRGDSPEQARQMAEQMAVTRSRSEGLLLNPHYQDSEVW